MTDSGTTTGPRLRAERERRGLSAQKAADELHLDGWVIDALEADEYARVGPSVYAKGHLKRYAELLGLPAAEIVVVHGREIVVDQRISVQHFKRGAKVFNPRGQGS